MERGEIFSQGKPTRVFVFDSVIGELVHPLVEKAALRVRRYEAAFDAWNIRPKVCDYMRRLSEQYDTPIEVITWRPHGFADVINDRLWGLDVYVSRVRALEYQDASPLFATDTTVSCVYDDDPAHRVGYGWKCREFSLEVY